MRRPIIFLLFFSFSFTLLGCGNRATVEFLNSPARKKSNSPFSEAVRVNNILYLSYPERLEFLVDKRNQ